MVNDEWDECASYGLPDGEMLVIDCSIIFGGLPKTTTKVLAEFVSSCNRLSEVEMHDIRQTSDFLGHGLGQPFEFLDGETLDTSVWCRAVLHKPGDDGPSSFLVSAICVQHIRWQAAEGDFMRRVEQHFDVLVLLVVPVRKEKCGQRNPSL